MSKSIDVKMLADSICDGGSRLITWELSYHRYIHSELMTHRVMSRNAASSRAIPASRLRERIFINPAIPVHFGANQKGMQADGEVADVAAAEAWWLEGRDLMVAHHAKGEAMGLHKQILNRPIEPWMIITTIVSMTDHANLFFVRKHKDAQPEFRELVTEMWELFHDSTPTWREVGEWHLPLVSDDPKDPMYVPPEYENEKKKISVGRAARVSYLTHSGQRDFQADIELCDRLTAPPLGDPSHASPGEHAAVAVGGRKRIGNFEGWKQFRKTIEGESGPDTSNRCNRCGLWTGEHTKGCPIGSLPKQDSEKSSANIFPPRPPGPL